MYTKSNLLSHQSCLYIFSALCDFISYLIRCRNWKLEWNLCHSCCVYQNNENTFWNLWK